MQTAREEAEEIPLEELEAAGMMGQGITVMDPNHSSILAWR